MITINDFRDALTNNSATTKALNVTISTCTLTTSTAIRKTLRNTSNASDIITIPTGARFLGLTYDNTTTHRASVNTMRIQAFFEMKLMVLLDALILHFLINNQPK